MNTIITTTKNEINFKNQFCAFSFDLVNKEISGSDLSDNYNMPRCYNKTTRSFKKALQSVNTLFNNDMSMYQVMNIICNSGIKMRSYCSMD